MSKILEIAENTASSLEGTLTALHLFMENMGLEAHNPERDSATALIFLDRFEMYRALYDVIYRDLLHQANTIRNAVEEHYNEQRQERMGEK